MRVSRPHTIRSRVGSPVPVTWTASASACNGRAGPMPRLKLIDETGQVGPRRLAEVSAALGIQLDRDLMASWGSSATIRPGTRETLGDDWRLSILSPDRLPPMLEGVHLDDAGRPFALIAMSDRWTVTASHEMLEMIVNPFGDRFVMAPSIETAANGRSVRYLHEVCDPCQTISYLIEGVEVSNFVHSGFYHPGATGPVDQMGALAGPLAVPSGCALCWIDPVDNRWRQQQPNGSIITLPSEEPVRH